GIDRPLVRARDFIRYIVHEARVELIDLMDGRKRFRGPIVAADEDTFTIRLPEAPKDTDPNFRLPLANLAEAKLIMTDALMDMARTAQESENPLDNPELETEADDDDFDGDVEALNDEDEIGDLEDLDGIEDDDDDDDEIVKN
ncbi:MAG: ribosome maturation factor RimP, partial [Rhodospirillaceae bacterium]|nr:ribosome maturation factor RimP [Rhodospirillaceae bacterium]